MSLYKEHKFDSVSSRFLAIPVFMKIANAMYVTYSKIAGTKENDVHRLTLQPIHQPVTSRHDAIINLLNKGKNYNNAELIVDMSSDWDLNLDLFEASTIDVKGGSVWINLED